MSVDLYHYYFLYIAMSAIGMYLPFCKFSSRVWIKQFAIWDNPQNPDYSTKGLAIKRFFYSNGLRVLLLISSTAIVIPLFTNDFGGINYLLTSNFYKIFTIMMAIIYLSWSWFFGPINLAKRHNQKLSFRSHFVPYFAATPSIVAPWVVIIPLLVSAVILSVIKDYQQITTSIYQVAELFSNKTLNCPISLENIILEIIFLGKTLSMITQKYLVVGIIALLYSIAEQTTYMKRTVVDKNFEVIRLVAYFIIVTSLIFGIVILPSNYIQFYNIFYSYFSNQYLNILNKENTELLISLFNLLETHGISWYYQQVLTGFGNLVTYIVIIVSIVIKQTLFKDTPAIDVIRFFLPQEIFQKAIIILSYVGIHVEKI